jgi:hypothetical protein
MVLAVLEDPEEDHGGDEDRLIAFCRVTNTDPSGRAIGSALVRRYFLLFPFRLAALSEAVSHLDTRKLQPYSTCNPLEHTLPLGRVSCRACV